ncbi:MAG TPA: glycosyltransferase [Blastocatellia bacterium]|nr:glycosyltransferase [Blastocatellia bacterium]
MQPLISILIPAYNAQEFLAETLRSAIAQTWKRKEIIVADDGSTDRTPGIARSFASSGVTVVSRKNGGLSAAQNEAFRHSQGDYIQWLDADDLLAPDKIERQLAALRGGDSKRTLLSSPWAPFHYRTRGACFVRNSVSQDLSPVEWLLRKLGENLHMQNATWLVSRELTEAAGPWNESLQYDQDGEYFTRVLVASEGTRFVPGTGIYYRARGSSQLSYVGNSDKKKDSLLVSMKLHIQYLRSLEESERVRKACVAYLRNWYDCFYPERPDLVAEVQALAAELHGHLDPPRLRWKYAWMEPMFGWKVAREAQRTLPQLKDSCIRQWDRAMYRLEGTQRLVVHAGHSVSTT